jgi:pimeloyl-ACP methyl ester carboxylesterase
MKTRLLACGLLAAALGSAFLPAADGAGTQTAHGATASGFGVDWAPCEGDATTALCGKLRVPLDWSKPRGQQIQVAVARRPADDPSRLVGTVFFNPGGPGDGAVDDVAAAEQIFSAPMLERFDIVGVDPRGVGGSARVRCEVPVLTPGDTLFPSSRQEFQNLRRHNRAVGLSCLDQTGPLMGHVDTVSVARDHEALRIALGVRQVSWLGLSYGTQLAANYAQLYPQRTRAMVLDAALEHSLPEVVQVADEAMAAEDSFNRFIDWCRTAPTCALRGRDVATLYDDLVASADQDPIPVDGALRPVTGEDIRTRTVGLLRVKEPSPIFGPDLNWPGLSRAIAAALDGNAAAFALPPAKLLQEELSTLLAIGCMEYVPQVNNYGEMRQRIQMGRQLAPHLQGASETWQVNRCIDWPIPVANPPRLLDVRGVPTLIVHATHDPSVPYKWAHSLAAQIRGSDLLTRAGDGHTSYHTSPCARAAITRYLIRPQAPPDRVCAD